MLKKDTIYFLRFFFFLISNPKIYYLKEFIEFMPIYEMYS